MLWYFNNQEFSKEDVKDYVGFVYLITEIDTNKQYIGQKVFFNKVAKKPLKGMKNRRLSKKFSNWEEYFGSNDLLNEQVSLKGATNYKREIIRLCKSKAEMNYYEAFEIFNRGALLTDKFYNNWISCRINKNQLKFKNVD